MKKLIRLLIIGFIGVLIISCHSKATISISESQFYIDSIYSKNLEEYRKHNVYLPKGFNIEKKYPIIYATDGSEQIENNFFKRVLDSLIQNDIIEPTIYIGSHSNSKIADSTNSKAGDGKKILLQYRNFEYVEQSDLETYMPNLADRFINHMLYFTDELIPQVEQTLHQNNDRKDRIFYGVSNGAGFGANLLNKYPEIIGTYVCYSTLGSNVERNNWDENKAYPNLYLQYGNEESFIFKLEAEDLKDKYDELNLFCELKSFDGGHDYEKWNEAFISTISKLLKAE